MLASSIKLLSMIRHDIEKEKNSIILNSLIWLEVWFVRLVLQKWFLPNQTGQTLPNDKRIQVTRVVSVLKTTRLCLLDATRFFSHWTHTRFLALHGEGSGDNESHLLLVLVAIGVTTS